MAVEVGVALAVGVAVVGGYMGMPVQTAVAGTPGQLHVP